MNIASGPGADHGSVGEPGRLQITFDCLDPARAGTFWAAVLGYPVPDVEGWHNFLRSRGRPEEDLNATFAIEDPTGARPRMFFQRVPEPKSVKNRVHLDLAAPAIDGADRAGQIDAFARRLTALGAHWLRAVKEDDLYFVVMADPEGNEFCVD
jgi:catechol 2,3-dioxygenase-like lactoylglutathione lyase family enzyme